MFAWSRTSFSLSSNNGQTAGKIFPAISSSEKQSAVAVSACNAAFRACTNGSRSDRVKAAIRTFERVDTPRERAIFPRQIVVLVRIPGCSSLEVRASCLRRSELIVRSDSLVIMIRTALTVCSRIRGAISVKPVTYTRLLEQ